MSKIQAISDGQGGYIYPVTIADAIIDPQTGEPAALGGGSNVEYTINDQSADENGNFTIDAASIGAAVTGHTHAISDVTDLQATLNSLAVTGHTHTMVHSLVVGGSTVTGDIVMQGTGNVQLLLVDNTINIRVTPHTVDTTSSITSTEDEQYAIFVGTEAEWNTFAAGTTAGEKYLVFIRS